MGTIKNRLYWGFGTLIFVLIVNIVLTQIVSRQSTKTYEKLKTEIAPTMTMLDEYQSTNNELLLVSRNKVVRYDEDYTNRMKGIIEVALPHFKTEVFLLKQALSPNDPKIGILNTIISLTDQSIKTVSDINLLLLTPEDYNISLKLAKATQKANHELSDLSLRIDRGIARIQRDYDSKFDSYQSNLSSELNQLSGYIFIIGIVGIILGITIASGTIRSIIRPIHILQTSARRISRGDYKLAIPVKGKNELASLGSSFNTMAASLQKNFEEINLKNKELERFVYIASHDLQEPLRTMTSFTELFEKECSTQLDENSRTYLRYMGEASTRMSHLVKGLLDHSQIGQSKKPSKVDCNILIEEVQSDLALSIKATNTVLSADDLPTLDGHVTELRLLFQNLINNAVKFRLPNVSPKITIASEEISGFWKFAVQDNGIGIPDQYREKVFDIFSRLHNRNKYEGTGIGLAHCRKIVEMHGGKIWVESTPNKGSIFYFTISNQKS